MGVTRLWYHTRRKTDDLGNVAELPDKTDLLEAFQAFAATGLNDDSLVRRETESYVRLRGFKPIGRSITFEFESGRFGEDGTIRDVRTHAEIGTYGRGNATTVITHGVLLVPKTGTSALIFSERSGGQGGMSGLLDRYVELFNSRSENHIMKKQSVVKTEAWLKAAKLLKVQGTVRKHRTDRASDPADRVVGDLTHTFAPTQGEKYLPRRIWEGLRDHRIDRAKFLGFEEGTELDEVDVTLTDGTQSKKFELGREKTPALNLVLTTSGQAAPTSGKVLNTALDEAAEIFRYYGIEWSEASAIRSAIPKKN